MGADTVDESLPVGADSMTAATRTLEVGAALVADGRGRGGGGGALPGTRVRSPSLDINVELEGDEMEDIIVEL